MSMHAIIMAGGSGTRFWPASRRNRPKQFLPLAEGRSLLAATVDRVCTFAGPERTWIITNAAQAARVPEFLDGFPAEQIIIEPESRDTAPCVALAAATIEAREPGASMIVMPADHMIEPKEAFHALIDRAAALAGDDATLVTFGIPPTYPATGFGYIELGNAIPGHADAFEVLHFREKPDRTTARTFAGSGQFLWNSGIFVWNYSSLTRAMRIADAGLADGTEEMLVATQNGDAATIEATFRALPKTSIDYAVMERADRVAVLRANFAWSDLGSFPALTALGRRDAYGNLVVSHDGAEAILHQSENCVVYGEGRRTVTLFGARDLVVVQTDDAILVCPRERADDVKELIVAIRDAGREDLL